MPQGQTRTYEASHPWISFGKVDLSPASFRLWMLLGEAGSKVEHLRGVPLRPEAERQLQTVYLAKGALASAQIEGNTLSEEDALLLAQDREIALPPSQEYLGQEVENIIAAVNDIAAGLRESGPEPVTPELIKDFNRRVLKDLNLDDGVVAGEYRTKSVVVGPYRGAPAEDMSFLVNKLCDWLQTGFEPAEERDDLRLTFAIIKAVMAHLYFEWIHPFGDGNGRTGRLVEFHILVSSGVPFPAAHLLSNHYNLTRSDYYRQLQAASASGGEVIPFVEYAVQGFVDGLRSQIERVQSEQMDVMWENYVHQVVPGGTSTAERRRTLVFGLTRADRAVARRELMQLTSEISAAYLGKTSKTLTRDLNLLRDLSLVLRRADGWMANKDLVRGFVPQAVAVSR